MIAIFMLRWMDTTINDHVRLIGKKKTSSRTGTLAKNLLAFTSISVSHVINQCNHATMYTKPRPAFQPLLGFINLSRPVNFRKLN